MIPGKTILRNADTVSFDIFDTLTERKNIKDPRDVFWLTAKEIIPNVDPIAYCMDRIRAEKKARAKKDSREATLAEIYDELPESYAADRNRLQEKEEALELDLAQPKKEIVKIYDQCRQSGKRVFIVSDMYLPEELILRMLKKCGVNIPDGLYISNVYSADKRSGKLFQILINEQNITPGRHVHIGDDPKGDYLGAKKNGMQAILIRRKYRIRRVIHSLIYKIRLKSASRPILD